MKRSLSRENDAAKAAGHTLDVPFTPGRVDATQEQADVESFEYLRPAATGFRNFYSERARLSPTEMLVDRADLLTLTVPEMTVLVAGMHVLDASAANAKHSVFTDTPDMLSNDFFIKLLDMGTTWAPFEGHSGCSRTCLSGGHARRRNGPLAYGGNDHPKRG